MKWLPYVVVVFLLFSPALVIAQDETPPPADAPDGGAEPADAPAEEPAEEEPAEEEPARDAASAIASIDNWQGEVLLKKTGSADFDIVAPVGDEKTALFFGDTIKTSDGASITLTLQDGTIIELGPNSELVLEQNSEGTYTARLNYGHADVTIGSDSFVFVCARHKITGEGSRFAVNSPDVNNIDIFGIEDGTVIENEYGLIIYLGQGQKMESTYLEDVSLFKVTVHEYNEVGLKVEVGGEGKLFDPGTQFTVDPELNIEIMGAVEPPPSEAPEPVTPPLEFNDAEDEPFEDAGDIQAINKVTPTKP